MEAAVLDAAQRVFAERGFDGVSVEHVAAAAGLTKGAVYSRFPTKEALFVAAARAHEDEVLTRLSGRSPRQWARSWARGLVGERRWSLLGLEFRLYGLRHASVASVVRDWQRRSHDRLRETVEQRVADAGLRLRVPAADAAAILAAAAAGIAQQRYADPDVAAERLMRSVIELLVEER